MPAIAKSRLLTGGYRPPPPLFWAGLWRIAWAGPSIGGDKPKMSTLFIIESQAGYPDWGDIAVDVHKSDNHILSSEVSEHTLEAGSVVSDHVISKPRQLSIIFEQVNTKDGLARAVRVW